MYKYFILFSIFLSCGCVEASSCNATYNAENASACIDKHTSFALDWFTGKKTKEALAMTKAVLDAIGGGFLNEIHNAHMGSRESSHGGHILLSKKKDRADMMGEGITSTVALVAPYLFFLGGGLGAAATWVVIGEAIVAGGISYIVLNKIFDFASFEGNRRTCQKMCKVIQIENGKSHSLLAKIAAYHFGSTIQSLMRERETEKSGFRSVSLIEEEKNLFPEAMFPTENEALDPHLLITRLSESTSPILAAYIRSGAHCLMNCPDHTAVDFTCEFLKEMDDNMSNLLYFAQVLSISHTNFVSFDSVKNSNLAKFLKQTRPRENGTLSAKARRIGRYDEGKYGTAENNMCARSDLTKLKNKLEMLIAFQLALENKTKIKEDALLNSNYNSSSCKQNCDGVSFENLHNACKEHIRILSENEKAKRKAAIYEFQLAIRTKDGSYKQRHYAACVKQ